MLSRSEMFTEVQIEARMELLRVRLLRDLRVLKSLGIPEDLSETELRKRAIESLEEDLKEF